MSVWGSSTRRQAVQEEYVFGVFDPEDIGTVILRSIWNYSPSNTAWHPNGLHCSKINVQPYGNYIPENKNLLIYLRVYKIHASDGGNAQWNGGVREH